VVHEWAVVLRTSTARPATGRRSRLADRDQTRTFVRWLVLGTLRVTRAAAGFAIGFSALGLCAYGVFRDPGQTGTPQLLALTGLAVLLLARLFERLQRGLTAGRDEVWANLELGTLFLAAAFAVIEITGGPSGLLYPLVYALVAFLVAFHGMWQSLYFLALILGAEAATWTLQPEPDGWRLFASHASFNLLFGFLYALFLRSEINQRRLRLREEIEDHLGTIAAEARDFRLTSGLSLESRDMTPDEIKRRRSVGSVQAIHESLYAVLAVAERAIEPYTVALLWLEADDRTLRVKELRSQSDQVLETPIVAAEGLLGAITKRREPLVLSNLKPNHSGLVYYGRREPITDFAGVPVMEGNNLRGVLIADRVNGRGFDEADLAVMTTVAAEIVRAVQVERVFAEMDREKYQKERFYQASRDFNTARTVDQVAEVAIQTARRVAEIELAAVVVATDREGILRITSLQWQDHPEAKDLLGKEFAAEDGLVGAAIKARHPLPHGTARTSAQCLFAPGVDVAIDSIKVLPLLWKDLGVGALVLGSSQPEFLTADLLDMLKVIADHAAIAIANAQMYERMERMATTDGLTGLTNHRHFQHLFDSVVARAERYSRRVSLIITDIDHFKAVNDTYGHPVGDQVLRRISTMLIANARRTDIVARYGGEEFAVLMEETGAKGATQTAERIRKAVEDETFRCENGNFKVTLSLGIATFPVDAGNKARLTECADQALYQAKRSGRNRSVSFGSSGAEMTAGD
jgi:diguanylate cyclase (GGDEF)-like protein